MEEINKFTVVLSEIKRRLDEHANQYTERKRAAFEKLFRDCTVEDIEMDRRRRKRRISDYDIRRSDW